MSNVDIERTAKSAPLAPVDTSVVIPERVKAAAALAESFYAPKTETPEGTPTEPPASDPAAEAAEAERARLAQEAAESASESATPAPQPKKKAPKPIVPAGTDVPPAEEVTEESWQHRFHSMKGRWEASQRTIGSMQEQMTQLGDELVRAQAMLRQLQTGRGPGRQAPAAPAQPLITPDDEQAYGPELIDLARRAAADALGPEVAALKQQNARLQQRVAQDAQSGVYQVMDRDIPNWREINRSPEFNSWLRLRDVYSGGVRKQLLNAAFQAADAPRVKAFFQGFINDEAVAGNIDLAPPPEQQVETPAPRQAAVPLATLAAPGKAKPASGNPPSPADKPVFTRAQIKKFYDDVRAQRYVGRDADKAALEKQIFDAQREGRVR